jgi:hypothetical protein
MGVEHEIGDVERHDMMTLFHILHSNHRPCSQPRVLGMFHHPNLRYM